MRRVAHAFFVPLVCLGAPAAAQPSPCIEAAARAEADAALPPGLLLAIGRVDSGRWNHATHSVEPWPWAVNIAGQGMLAGSAVEAMALVHAARRQGVLSIDIGCFQINLLHHPSAFASLEEGFDPAVNARYAARFLAALYQRTGDWAQATAHYHSATPGLGQPYSARVLAHWRGSPAAAAPGLAAAPVVAAVATVRVVVPAWAARAAAPVPTAGPRIAWVQPAASYRLPRVFIPGSAQAAGR